MLGAGLVALWPKLSTPASCLCGCTAHASPVSLSSTRYYANSLRHAELPAHSLGITTHQRELMGVGWDAEQRQFEARIWTRWGMLPPQLQGPASTKLSGLQCVCRGFTAVCQHRGCTKPAVPALNWELAITTPASGTLLKGAVKLWVPVAAPLPLGRPAASVCIA